MLEIMANKPYDLGYFRANNRNKTSGFDEKQDAIVLVFRLQYLGHVAVVISPVLANGYKAYYAGSARDAKIVAARDVADKFEGDRDDGSFELPWQMVLKYKNTEARICLKTSRGTACELASEERNRDAIEQGGFDKLLPFEHYLWWHENSLEEYTVEDVQLNTKTPQESYHGPLHDAMRVVEEAIIA